MRSGVKFITTTSSIEGYKIEKYLGIVTHQVVHGTDLFSDIFAGFRDVFGGYSASYQKKLKEMEDNVLNQLKKKAQKLGANAILGLRLDFDEISGKGKGMLMLTAQGTAVLLAIDGVENQELENGTVPFQILDYEMERDDYIEMISDPDYKIEDLAEIQDLAFYKIDAFDAFIKFIYNNSLSINDTKDLISEFMANVEFESITKHIRSELFLKISLNSFRKLIKVLGFYDWFDSDTIIYLLQSQHPFAHQKALYLLGFPKKQYSLEDIKGLKLLVNQIEHTFREYPIVIKKQGMFGKQKEEWTCMICGKSNEMHQEICSNIDCKANWFGIEQDKFRPEDVILKLQKRIEKIQQLLSEV